MEANPDNPQNAQENGHFLEQVSAYGARVGDIHLSPIHPCELNGINPFDYLRAREQHAEKVIKAPSD